PSFPTEVGKAATRLLSVAWRSSTNPKHRRKTEMTALSQSTRRKLSLLQLAEEIGNVSKPCRVMVYHRDTFYEVRRAFQVGGVSALVEKTRGAQSPHPNRVEHRCERRTREAKSKQVEQVGVGSWIALE